MTFRFSGIELASGKQRIVQVDASSPEEAIEKAVRRAARHGVQVEPNATATRVNRSLSPTNKTPWRRRLKILFAVGGSLALLGIGATVAGQHLFSKHKFSSTV